MKFTFKQAKQVLARYGVTLTKRDGEYRVNVVGGTEETAYYSDDQADAFNTGLLFGNPEAVLLDVALGTVTNLEAL